MWTQRNTSVVHQTEKSRSRSRSQRLEESRCSKCVIKTQFLKFFPLSIASLWLVFIPREALFTWYSLVPPDPSSLRQATPVGEIAHFQPSPEWPGLSLVLSCCCWTWVEKGMGVHFHLNREEWFPKGKLNCSLHNKGNGCRTDKNDSCPLHLCNLGDFFVMCIPFPLSALPAPWNARTLFIYSVSPMKPTIALWNEKLLFQSVSGCSDIKVHHSVWAQPRPFANDRAQWTSRTWPFLPNAVHGMPGTY